MSCRVFALEEASFQRGNEEQRREQNETLRLKERERCWRGGGGVGRIAVEMREKEREGRREMQS